MSKKPKKNTMSTMYDPLLNDAYRNATEEYAPIAKEEERLRKAKIKEDMALLAKWKREAEEADINE